MTPVVPLPVKTEVPPAPLKTESKPIPVKAEVPPAPVKVPEKAPEIGDVMPEGHAHAGWIYVGLSASTGKPLYAASQDSGVMMWKEAMEFAAKQGARLATDEELSQNLYANKDAGALKGTFNETGYAPSGFYWSSTHLNIFAGYQRFSDGDRRDWYYEYHHSSVRLVREDLTPSPQPPYVGGASWPPAN